MLRVALALGLFAAAAGAAWGVAPRLAALADARYAAQVDATLSAGGFGWAKGKVDGTVATISGAAPNAAAEAEALALVSAISPVLTVQNAVTAAPKIAPAVIPPELEILKGADGLILTGVIAEPSMAAALGGDSGLLRYGAAPFQADWAKTAPLLATVANTLRHARLTVSDRVITIDGLAETEEARDELSPSLDDLRAIGWRVAARIDAPPPVLKDFRLTIVKSLEGAEIACAAANHTDAATIEAAAKAHLNAETPCAIGAGAPDEDWPDAATAIIASLAPVETAEIALTGKVATLTITAPVTQTAAEQVATTLAATLPPGYRLIREGETSPPAGDAPPPFSLTIDWPGGDEPIAISSAQSGDGLTRAEASLAAYARALFPGAAAAFEDKKGAPPPDDWRRATRITLEALSRLERGAAEISDGAIALTGAATDIRDIRTAHDALAEAGAGWRIETRITYNPAALAAAQPLPPARCLTSITKAVTAAPISFQPGSTTLTASGPTTIGKIAAILTRCEGVRFEIGGHTDAQGSETGNLTLSRNRAEAVLSALIAAKAPPGRLTAKGYGEARPIADNATAVGRALNRRIEFTLIEDPE